MNNAIDNSASIKTIKGNFFINVVSLNFIIQILILKISQKYYNDYFLQIYTNKNNKIIKAFIK